MAQYGKASYWDERYTKCVRACALYDKALTGCECKSACVVYADSRRVLTRA